MMDESFLIQTIKDAACFVSQDALADLKLAHSRDSPHRYLHTLRCEHASIHDSVDHGTRAKCRLHNTRHMAQTRVRVARRAEPLARVLERSHGTGSHSW